jgi:hypothetical protein
MSMNHARPHLPGIPPCARPGFALVVTLSLMILLTVIAVGLLTLAGITLRGSAHTEARSAACANARLALVLALGDLQRQAGPDTRITARADILDKDNPPVLGVWQSWQGDDHETSGSFAGRPQSPGNYPGEKKKRFIAWLTSANAGDPATLPDTAPGDGKVTLIGTGALGAGSGRDKMQIHLTPTAVTTTHSQHGGIAWWIGGENQKARLPRPYQPTNDTAARWAVQAKSYPVADPEPFRLDPVIANPAAAAKAITLRQADLIATDTANKTSREFFHDLSAVSVGLLTNPSNGGWRKDLSLLTEKWDTQPTSNLPLFRLTPAKDAMFKRPSQGNSIPTGAMLYPWAAYRGDSNSGPIYQHGAVSSWENLMDFATTYKRITASSSGKLAIPIHAEAIFGNSYNFLHKVRILPIIARMQWVLSHSAGPLANNLLEPRLLLTPVITMWNPYNMEITSPTSMSIGVAPLPVALKYTINGTANSNYNSVMECSNNSPALGGGGLSYQINAPFTLKPGETRLFSPAAATPVPSGSSIALQAGYRSGGGHYFPVKDNSGATLALPGSATLKADAKFDSYYNDAGAIGVGIYLDMSIPGSWLLAYRMVYKPEVANVVYQPLTNLAEGTLGQSQSNPTPFLSTIFGARMASRTHLAAKGFVQSSPLVNYTAMGRKDEVESTIQRHYNGTAHPVNSPFDYSFVKHPAGGDSLLPNADDTTGRGYIVTGFNKADGLSRCVIDELPSRPLVSLGELVNWDLRYENPVPPFAFNLIGNSDATPLLPANAVVNARDKSLAANLQYDDSYCANHLLFDDWFVSSITPDPSAFGSAGGRDQKATFTDFVKGTTPLANRAYQPILEDQAAAADNAAKLYANHVAKTDSWKTIASRLEVEGMFNVNSTSVPAWRALLGHARKQRIPYVREAGNSWDAALAAETDYAVTRFSVSGDAKAGDSSTSGDFPEANDFAGYRTLDDKFLDTLAEKVVDQIRLRGPFLSLAEFVNRQLSSGNLALAGTLQAALNEATQGASNNPLAAVQSLSTAALAAPPSVAGSTPEYAFADAAAGYSGYGLPGWTRQADLLRPLAPILTVRDDTFTIRGYGDARDAQGHILAHAVCEAVVRRIRDFADPEDAPDILTPPTRDTNKTYGRRFQLISFRWLAANEV